MTSSSAGWLVAIVIIIVVAIVGGWFLSLRNTTVAPPATNGPPTPTPPQATYQNADANVIVVDTPRPGATVGTTFTVSGRARGNWYFEANFPLEVLSATGTRLMQTGVQAEGEWMTTDFVPFAVDVAISPNYKGAATLVLHNDNASGLLEHARSISIPIVIQ